MSLKKNLDKTIMPWALLKHPFYQAWESGDLPRGALQAYAREYGAFIATLPQGWQALDDEETANEEQDHIALWQQFAQGLDTEPGQAELPAVAALVATAGQLFAHPASATGALYAFEAQQPETAKTKLAGLRAHYSLPTSVEPYFEEHSHNEHEAEKLLAIFASLESADQDAAMEACAQMSKALWDALSDIYQTHCAM